MMHKAGINNKISGFTLVELLVAMAMFLVVISAIYSLFIANSRSYSSQEMEMVMTQDTRAAASMMIREIRMAGYAGDITNSPNPGFVTDSDPKYGTDEDSIRFTMDLNGNGVIDYPNEDINYYQYITGSGVGAIGRRIYGASGPATSSLAENITAMAFSYYDANDVELTPPLTATDLTDIRSIDVSITAETPRVDPVSRQKKTKRMKTRVRIRNAGL